MSRPLSSEAHLKSSEVLPSKKSACGPMDINGRIGYYGGIRQSADCGLPSDWWAEWKQGSSHISYWPVSVEITLRRRPGLGFLHRH